VFFRHFARQGVWGGTPQEFVAWLGQLEAASNISISSLSDFLGALKQRHDYFHSQGGRLSDHGLNYCCSAPCTEQQASAVFARARGVCPRREKRPNNLRRIFCYFRKAGRRRGWTKQLHLGALRRVNTRRTRELGSDKGYDGIGTGIRRRRFVRFLTNSTRTGAAQNDHL